MFKFKESSNKTKEIMSKVIQGQNPYINDRNESFEKNALEKIKKITRHEHCLLTNSGNNSIYIALSCQKEPVFIPDQGGWNGFKQIAKYLNKEVKLIKTNQGLIEVDNLDIENGSLILTSFAGYSGEQDIKNISKYCRDNNITLIEDASAGVGDKKSLLGNGKYSDIILASTGSPKIINVGSGGFICSNNSELFEETKIPQKLSKTSELIASGIDSEIDLVEKNLEQTINATTYLKKHLDNVIHKDKRGVNVIIKSNNPKEMAWKLKKELPINHHSFITKCPNYNRIKENAIAIEVKNLDYTSLEKKNLEKIIEVVNNLQLND